MRRPEGPAPDEPVLRASLPGHGVNLARDERLLLRHGRQDVRQGLGQGALPGARCTDHHDIVATGRGDFQALPFPVTKFVLMSSRDSVGGGPYVVEEEYPLMMPVSTRPASYELRP